jgi:anti-sigma-K factor RskA
MIRQMRHEDIRSLLGAYALDAVDASERAEVEAHLETCADCRREVDDHLAVASMLASADDATPDDLWTRVERRLDLDGEAETAEVVPISLLRRARAAAIGVGAVAALLALVVGFQTVRIGSLDADLVAAEGRLDRLEGALAAGDYGSLARTVSADPSADTMLLAGDQGIAVTIVMLPDGTGVLVSSSLVPLDAERTYQLWAVQDGAVISAGLLGANPGFVPFHVDPSRLDGLVITAERAGGVPVSEQPAVAAWFPDA